LGSSCLVHVLAARRRPAGSREATSSLYLQRPRGDAGRTILPLFETPHHLADASRDRRKTRTLGGCSKGLEHPPTRHLSTHGAGWRASTGGPVGDAPPRAHHGSPVRRGDGFAHRVSDRSPEFAHLSRVSRLSSTPNRVNLAPKIG
jgi:hypothetical protein